MFLLMSMAREMAALLLFFNAISLMVATCWAVREVRGRGVMVLVICFFFSRQPRRRGWWFIAARGVSVGWRFSVQNVPCGSPGT